ncbi:uncharacterized protein LOC132557621 [Ylistrum balloti]|uniref:uncharacterized protein LOC132557621 n=1 Tax=Ylistrum balloti TaxID=509963 RepID=UPI002905B6DB|nr:uncharacterized protein LOC132557621 [Ylistrum balloti]
MGDEEPLLMNRIGGSGKEMQAMVVPNKEAIEDKGRQKELLCHYCDKVFYKQKNLKVHLCIHTGEKKLQCNTCGKSFIQSCHLKRHLRSHSGEKPYSCDICGNQFSQNGHLRVHLKSHFGNKNYKCEYCPMAFVQNSHLKRHMRSHMTIRPYKCELCDKTYKFSDHLYIHLRRHTGETPYHCTLCDKAFHTSANLNAHVKIHNKYVDRKFKCQICVKKFHTNYALVKHMAVHTPETPFSCRLCSKSFKYKGNLKHHFDVHSNDANMKLLKCVICVKRCTSFQNLKDHMLSHYEETCKTHKCEICNKTFRIKSSLQMHHSLHTGLKLAYRCLEVSCQFESKTVEEMKDHCTTWHNVQVEDGLHNGTDNSTPSYDETEENVSASVKKLKCPMGCSQKFDNITDLVSHLKCHIKIEKTKKSVDHSSFGRISDSDVKKTVLGVGENALGSNTGAIQDNDGRQEKSSSQLDPVSMLIETAEQVLPGYRDQRSTGVQIHENLVEKATEQLIQINASPEEKQEMLVIDQSSYPHVTSAKLKGMFCNEKQYSNTPSTGKTTVSYSVVVPGSSGLEVSTSHDKMHQIPVLVQTLSSLSDENDNTENLLQNTEQTFQTIRESFGSRSTAGEKNDHIACSSLEINGNNYITHGIEQSESSFVTDKNGHQSLIVGKNMIRMLDKSDGTDSTENVQLHDENIQEIVVDEQTMHELVVGTTEIPISGGVDTRFYHLDHSANYHQQLSVEEVVVPTKPEEDVTDEDTIGSEGGINDLNQTVNKDVATLSSFSGSNDSSDISVTGSGKPNFVPNTFVPEVDETQFQYVPFTTEKSVFIDSIGDHRYVLSYGDNSVVAGETKVTEQQHSQLNMIGTKNTMHAQCPFCNEHFQDNKALKDHLRGHMVMSEKVVVNVVMYLCHVCDTEFNSKENLKTHLKSHI